MACCVRRHPYAPFRMWGLFIAHLINATLSARAAVGCSSMRSVGIFAALDTASFAGRVWCLSGRHDNTALGRCYRHRWLVLGKPPPPPGMSTKEYRCCDSMIEGLAQMGVLTNLLLTGLVLCGVLRWKEAAVVRVWFPYGWSSILYLAILVTVDAAQDVAMTRFCTELTDVAFEERVFSTWLRRSKLASFVCSSIAGCSFSFWFVTYSAHYLLPPAGGS